MSEVVPLFMGSGRPLKRYLSLDKDASRKLEVECSGFSCAVEPGGGIKNPAAAGFVGLADF